MVTKIPLVRIIMQFRNLLKEDSGNTYHEKGVYTCYIREMMKKS